MKRRRFLQTSALMTAAALTHFNALGKTGLNKIGIQLFSLPKPLENNFRDAIHMLSQIGYQEIEMYGPFPFSAESAKARWNAITPSVGFSGSGYFGLAASEVKTILNDNKISVPSIHTDLVTMQTKMSALGEAGNTLGFTYVGLPSIPQELRQTLDDYKKIAEEFNKVGAQAKKYGLKFSYHNHGYGLQEMEGDIPLNVILKNTDPDLVFFEMDLYWTTAGGADPVKLLTAHPGRYHLMHVKDMKEKVRFKGNGGDSQQWIELFPYMTTAGSGVLDLKGIIAAAKTSGVKHFFVEQDMVANPEVALKQSFDYLKSL